MKLTKGFTLIELMITIAILGILSSLAYQSYRGNVDISRRSDAQAALLNFANAMERYYTENGTYLGAAAGGNNTGSPAIFATESPVESTDKYYDLTIQAAAATTYTLRATPKNAQLTDGRLELTSASVRRWDKNNDGDFSDTGEDCWEDSC